MDKSKMFMQPRLYGLLVFYFVLGFLTLAVQNLAPLMYDEDRYFENVGALSLFIAAGVMFYVFVLSRRMYGAPKFFWGKQLVYLGLAGLFFFGAGEEISWGQRIFGIAEPASLAQKNVQGELNIHNLAIFENNPLLKSDNIFSIFWFGFAVLVPAGALMSGGFKKIAARWMPIVHWSVGALFLCNYFLAQVAKPAFSTLYSFQAVSFTQAVQEVKESNYELLFIFLALYALVDFRKPVQEV